MTHYHFIGIGGAGLSPIARYLLEKGHQISGSDLHISPAIQELEELGAQIFIGHQANQIKNADVIIRSSAIPDSNVEVMAGLVADIPVKKRIDFIGEMTAGKKVIAVAGTHGKTTTTAMISWCLNQLGLDPSFIIGGKSKNLGTNSHAGLGEFFVIEADEYDHMFLGLTPNLLVITNIEHDHPDHFPTEKHYFDAFKELTALIQPSGKLLVCGDHVGSRKLLEHVEGEFSKFSYGKDMPCDYLIQNIHHRPFCGISFDFARKDEWGKYESKTLDLQISGEHNARNACAALAVVHLLGENIDKAKIAMQVFSGTSRRFDIRGKVGGIVIIDDYAHHPSEIRATLAAARCRYPEKDIWCVWQPHTYSRTRELIRDFADAFGDCDHVIVTDVFASREKKQDFSSGEVVNLMRHPDAQHIGQFADVEIFLVNHLQPGDVLLVLSAGDADQISQDVLIRLSVKENNIHD